MLSGTIIMADLAITFSLRILNQAILEQCEAENLPYAERPMPEIGYDYCVTDSHTGRMETCQGVNKEGFELALMFAVGGDDVGTKFGADMDSDLYEQLYEMAESVQPLNQDLRWIP